MGKELRCFHRHLITEHPQCFLRGDIKYDFKDDREFERLTGCGVIVNTSFNVRGEPIVCTPEDAYRCFMRTEMDVLVMEDCILYKEEQPKWEEKGGWLDEFELD